MIIDSIDLILPPDFNEERDLLGWFKVSLGESPDKCMPYYTEDISGQVRTTFYFSDSGPERIFLSSLIDNKLMVREEFFKEPIFRHPSDSNSLLKRVANLAEGSIYWNATEDEYHFIKSQLDPVEIEKIQVGSEVRLFESASEHFKLRDGSYLVEDILKDVVLVSNIREPSSVEVATKGWIPTGKLLKRI